MIDPILFFFGHKHKGVLKFSSVLLASAPKN